MHFCQLISPKSWWPFFSHLTIFEPSFVNIFLDAPLILDAQGHEFFFLLLFMHLPLFFNIYIHFFRKLPRWMPPAWMPGAFAPPGTPLWTPLLSLPFPVFSETPEDFFYLLVRAGVSKLFRPHWWLFKAQWAKRTITLKLGLPKIWLISNRL